MGISTQQNRQQESCTKSSIHSRTMSFIDSETTRSINSKTMSSINSETTSSIDPETSPRADLKTAMKTEIEDLPLEIWLRILDTLSMKDLLNFTRVSKGSRNLVNIWSKWKNFREY